jgi:hypothetical protein
MSPGLIVPNDLVGWWCPSIDATGGILLNRSGRNNHGTLTNMDPASDWVVSGGKLALDFDGANDYIIGNQVFAGAFVSVSIWAFFRSNPANYPMLFQLRNSASGNAVNSYQFLHRPNGDGYGGGSGSRLVWVANGATGVAVFPSVGLVSNEWAHYGLTYNGETLRIYKNGIEVASAAQTAVPSGINQFNLGNNLANTGDGYFDGQLDDVRIYNRALTAGEVRQLWQTGRGNMPLRRRRRYAQQAGFKPYWARRQSQLIGGGV